MAWRKSWSKENIYGINGDGVCKKRKLNPATRSVLDDYLDLAELSPVRGKVCIANDIGYTEEQLSKILNTPIDILKSAEKLLIKNSTIAIDKDRVILFKNWGKYQSEYERQKKYRVTTNSYNPKLQKEGTKISSLSLSLSTSKENKKVLYKEYVYLTKDEYEKLNKELGKSKLENLIADLNNGIGSKGYKYDSHYHTLLTWAKKDKEQEKPRSPVRDTRPDWMKEARKKKPTPASLS